jgi:hypothetical protein
VNRSTNRTFTAFCAGSLVTTSITSLWMDYYGRVGFAQVMLDHWTPGWISVPLAVVFFLVGFYFFLKCRAIEQAIEVTDFCNQIESEREATEAHDFQG